ncbi:hypothetical protein K523DRAFT_161071 [Schizophyllum commune Tattone D]|nr:hypothetical protein K523DRAFT_161071 [Schizophyllum commune Tattone D]
MPPAQRLGDDLRVVSAASKSFSMPSSRRNPSPFALLALHPLLVVGVCVLSLISSRARGAARVEGDCCSQGDYGMDGPR